MKHRIRPTCFARVLSILLCILLTAGLCACGKSDAPKETSPSAQAQPTQTSQDILAKSRAQKYFTEDEAAATEQQKKVRADFDAYLEKSFTENARTAGLLNIHFMMRRPEDYGVTEQNSLFGALTAVGTDASSETARKELAEFSYNDLSRRQQLVYDILNFYLFAEADMAPYAYYQEPLSTSSGLHSLIPIYFAEYTFTRVQDVEDYLTLMNSLPAFFDEVIAYEQKRADLGIFMSKEALDVVIDQARAILNSEVDDFYLNETFADMLGSVDGLSETDIADYKQRHRSALENSFFPAYDRLISALDGMRSSCKDIGGAVNLPDGQAYIEAFCRSYLATDLSLGKIKAAIESANNSLHTKLQALASLNPDAASKAMSYKQPSTDPAGIVAHLIDFYADRFPSLGECTYKIHYVPKGMEGSVSPAFFIIPALDDYKNNNKIYINNGSVGNNGLFTTLAHEGYPGHMLQGTYYAATKPYPIRSLLTFLPYSEGWATYVEHLSFEAIDDLDSTTKKLLDINSRMSLNALALVDLGLNYEGWTYKEYTDYMAINFNLKTGTDAEQLQQIYLAMTSAPFTYLPYAFGSLEVERIITEQSDLLGSKELYQIHDAFINIGPAPLHVVEKYMKTILAP